MKSRTLFLLAISITVWASAYPAIRVALGVAAADAAHGYGPFQMAAFRYLVAGIGMAAVALLTRKVRLPERKDLPRILTIGLTGITIYHLALNYGEQTVTAGAASFIINTSPVFTALLSVMILGERVRVLGWFGMVMSLSGVALIALGESGNLVFGLGALAILVSAISSSFFNVLQKPLLERYSAFEIVCYAVWVGMLTMAPFLVGLPSAVAEASAAATWSVVYLGLFPGAFAYWVWALALQQAPASRVVSFLYLLPPITLIISFVWIGEMPTWISLVGGAMALAGVIFVNARRAEAAVTTEQA